MACLMSLFVDKSQCTVIVAPTAGVFRVPADVFTSAKCLLQWEIIVYIPLNHVLKSSFNGGGG